ncbi:MAG: NAD(P)H-binding protein [Roseinatronobacter sp.]
MPTLIVLGATGTIGRAVCLEALTQGYRVVCLLRDAPKTLLPDGAEARILDLHDGTRLAAAMTGADGVISCIASRTGTPHNAWAVDHDAQLRALRATEHAKVPHFILLSAICVQKPLLEFQRAKLAFEATLQASPLRWSIVRPTAFFKSLSGQITRLQAGKPFLIFGDGTLTACKPISDRDLARFLLGCLTEPARWNQILPIGGPGPALSARAQGEMLFDLLGKPPRFRSVPVGMMDAIIGVLGVLGRVSVTLRDKADFARIGRYYATESMLVWDPARQVYDADATPEFGQDTLRDHYAAVLAGKAQVDLGAHSVF